MCYEIVQVNFNVESIPDDKLSDPENKYAADYGTRGIYPFSFPAEFLAETAIEQIFGEYERIQAGDFGDLGQEDIATVKKMFEYPVGLVEIHTGEVILYRDAPRPNLDAFETSDESKLAYGLADLRIADPASSTGLVTLRNRLESVLTYSLVGVSAETLVELTAEYVASASDPETTDKQLDTVVKGIAAKLIESLPAGFQGGVQAVDVETGQPVDLSGGSGNSADNSDPNPFGGLKLRG